MKSVSAIMLSLLLMWMQVAVMAQPAKADAPAKCSRCACKRNCCVTQSNPPESAPQPAAPAQSVQVHLQLFVLSASPAWLLPRGDAEAFSSPASSPRSAVGVPLFQRDCALLI